MGLSEQEKATLAALQKKANEPDPPPIGKSIRVNVDLSDEKQVALAIKHGFLTADEAADMRDDGGDGDGDSDGDEKPKRRGYFPDN